MDEIVPSEIQRDFSDLVPDLVLFSWLDQLDRQNALYNKLVQAVAFQERDRDRKLDSFRLLEEFFGFFSLPVDQNSQMILKGSPELIKTVSERLRKLKAHFRDHRFSSLQEIFELLYPLPSRYYQALRKKFPDPYRCMEALYGVVNDQDKIDYSRISSLLPTLTPLSEEKEDTTTIPFSALIKSHKDTLRGSSPFFAEEVFRFLRVKKNPSLEVLLPVLSLLEKYHMVRLCSTKDAIQLWINLPGRIKEDSDWNRLWNIFCLANPQLKWQTEIEKIFLQDKKNREILNDSSPEIRGAFMGPRFLSESLRQCLFVSNSKQFKPDQNLTGRGEVTFYPRCDKPVFYFKKNPELPGYEYAATSFLRQWGLEGIPHSDLLIFYDPDDEPYPVLMMEAVAGALIHEIWDQQDAFSRLDPHHTGLLLLAFMLLNPEDGKEDNHILSLDGKRIIPIDNDHVFLPGVRHEQGTLWTGYKIYDHLQIKNLLFCLDEMLQPFPQTVVNHITSLSINKILKKWLKNLVDVNDRYQSLFTEKQLFKLWDQKGVSLRVSFPETVVRNFYFKAHLMQDLLNVYPTLRPLDLLMRLEPYAGKKYRETFELFPVDSSYPRNAFLKKRVQEQFKGLYTSHQVVSEKQNSQVHVSILNSRQIIEILDIPAEEIHGSSLKAKIGPSAALDVLKELISERKRHASDNSLDLTLANLEAASLTRSQETENLKKFLTCPQKRLAIYDSKTLTYWELEKYFQAYGGTILYLDLRGAQNIDNRGFDVIANYCLNLEYLNTTQWVRLTAAVISQEKTSQNIYPFPRLKRWVANNNPYLKEIRGIFPELLILEAANNEVLSHLRLQVPQLIHCDLRGLNQLKEDTLEIQGNTNLRVKGGVTNKEFKDTYRLALRDNLDAQNTVGWMYQKGVGVKKDYAEAVAWYRKAAEGGYARAQYNVGYMYSIGCGVHRDYNQALEWYQKAAAQNDALAQRGIGVMYHLGDGVKKDYVEAMAWYRRAAAQNDALAQTTIGYMYHFGNGVTKNWAKALEWYMKAANKENENAQYNIGWMYYNGQEVDQNYAEALKWFKKSAEKETSNATTGIFYAGFMYEHGLGIPKDSEKANRYFDMLYQLQFQLEDYSLNYRAKGLLYSRSNIFYRDLTKAFEAFQKSSEEGDFSSQALLGRLYKEGQGTERDLTKAVEWLNKSLEGNNHWGRYNLALMYRDGEGVEQNDGKALDLLLLAAEQREDNAQYTLAWMYENGRGTPVNKEEAQKWYQRANKRHPHDALYSLGRMYEYGLTVDKNLDKALEYYEQATLLGDLNAQEKLKLLKNRAYQEFCVSR